MGETRSKGQKTAATNKARYGDEFYVRIGKKGGQNGHNGGFKATTVGKDGLTGPQRAAIVGRKGGRISKRRSAK